MDRGLSDRVEHLSILLDISGNIFFSVLMSLKSGDLLGRTILNVGLEGIVGDFAVLIWLCSTVKLSSLMSSSSGCSL